MKHTNGQNISKSAKLQPMMMYILENHQTLLKLLSKDSEVSCCNCCLTISEITEEVKISKILCHKTFTQNSGMMLTATKSVCLAI